MAGNSYGQLFRVTTFGESHGEAIGVVIDGCPPRLDIDYAFIETELARRKPGQSSITTSRAETEEFDILSGVFEGKTTGTPIAIVVRNKDQRSEDYEKLKHVYRPSHADYTYDAKYRIRDYRGGGRASARETVARVLAGSIAKLLLKKHDILIQAYVSQVHHIKLEKHYTELDLSLSEKNRVRCPDMKTAQQMVDLIEQVKKEGDSVGGIISCVIKNTPAGLGEPVFDKLHADLGKAILSINACKGFDIGSGFDSIVMKGSEHNDAFEKQHGKISTTSNYSGGIQGGISNGNDIFFRCAFKPTSTIMKYQKTVDEKGEAIQLLASGRHDPCILPRAVPIVEAMAATTLADHLMRQHAIIT